MIYKWIPGPLTNCIELAKSSGRMAVDLNLDSIFLAFLGFRINLN